MLRFTQYLIGQNNEIAMEMKDFFASKLGIDNKDQLFQLFQSIVAEFKHVAKDRGNYNKNGDFMYVSYFEQHIKKLQIKIKNYIKDHSDNPELIFEFLKYFYDNFNILYDDESGMRVSYEFIDTIVSLLINFPSSSLEQQLFKLLTDGLKDCHLSSEQFNLYLNRFCSPDDRQIQYQCLKNNRLIARYFEQFKQIATECNYSEQQVIEDMMAVPHPSANIVEYLIKYHQEQGNTDQEEKLLIELDDDDRLISFYQKHQQIDKLKQLLSTLMKENFRLEYYIQMKKLYSESKWLDIREQFIDYGQRNGDPAKIYYIEKMIPELDNVTRWYESCPFEHLTLLYPFYKEKINNYLVNLIIDLEKSVDESAYYSIVSMIERLEICQENEHLIRSILEDIYYVYAKKRPLMRSILGELFKHYLAKS